MQRLSVWAVFTGLAGCGTANDSTDALDADVPDAAPAGTFTEIYERFFPADTPAKCDFCHSQPASNISNGHLHLGLAGERAVAYAALVGQTSTSEKCMGKALVVPGHPEESLLFTKFSDAPPCGGRMPLGADKLTAFELELVRSWIAAGAQDN